MKLSCKHIFRNKHTKIYYHSVKFCLDTFGIYLGFNRSVSLKQIGTEEQVFKWHFLCRRESHHPNRINCVEFVNYRSYISSGIPPPKKIFSFVFFPISVLSNHFMVDTANLWIVFFFFFFVEILKIVFCSVGGHWKTLNIKWC